MRYIQAVRPFFHGSANRSPDDPPFAVHEKHAAIFIGQGLAVAVSSVEPEGDPLPDEAGPGHIERAVNPAPTKGRKAVAKGT